MRHRARVMTALLALAIAALSPRAATGDGADAGPSPPPPSPAPAPSAAPSASPASAPPGPAAPIAGVRATHIPMGPTRRAQMAAYSRRHYGDDTWELTPRAIVLHYTCSPSFSSAFHTFANNRPHHGEPPGVSAHYMVDFDGTAHELVAPTTRARHATGLNHVAIGVEFVQPCVRRGAGAAEAELLGRTAQLEAGVRLVRALQQRFGIPTENVIGHAMANRSALFRDLTGRTNDHGDWRRGAVLAFRQRLEQGARVATAGAAP